MNFVHLGDTHLGASNFKLKEREQDFLDSFKQVVDYCIKEKPEFIIHSGDLFDKGKPSNKVILFTIKQLKRLKKAGIPFLITPGSHDVSVEGTFITILEKVGLLQNVGKPENFVEKAGKYLMKGEVVGKAIVYGLPGRRANVKEIYDSVRPEKSNKFKIFLFHHIISSIKGSEYFADIPPSLLPKGMDYYAGGHWHEYESLKHENKPLVYPGSTDYSDTLLMEKEKARGFIHYKDKPVFIKLKTREVSVKIIDCNGLNPEQAVNKCISSLKDSNNGLIILKLKGTLGKGKRNEIDIDLIKKKALKKGYLHCNIKLSGLNNPGDEAISTGSKTLQEIEKEFLKNKGYNPNEVEMARQLIEILGRNYTQTELENALKKAGELIDN